MLSQFRDVSRRWPARRLATVLACAHCAHAAPAGSQPSPQGVVRLEGEYAVVSLVRLDRELEALQAAGRPVPQDLQQLGGGNWPVALAEQPDDVLLYLRRDAQRPALHIDSLLVLYRNVHSA